MADVRSLLRKEQAARRIDHPQATYSTKGTLICRVCNLQLKSDSLWNGHLRSTQHQMKAQRLKDSGDTSAISQTTSASIPIGDNTKRRRADSDGSPTTYGTAKRVKSGPGALPDDFFDATHTIQEEATEPLNQQPIASTVTNQSVPPTPTTITLQPKASVDEDEWAAFEADIAQTEEVAAISADAVISAPALTAEELAAQAREAQSVQRESKEIEVEAEKEDAVRKLEEEFEEMAAMESKIQKLKEKREALRSRDTTSVATTTQVKPVSDVDMGDSDDGDFDDEDDGFSFFHGQT